MLILAQDIPRRCNTNISEEYSAQIVTWNSRITQIERIRSPARQKRKRYMTENLNFWETILHYVRTLDHDGCAFRRVTGLYCPGCGGTRALAELSHGHLIGSFLCHPLVIYLPLALLILCLATLLRQLMKKQRKRTIGQLLTVLLMLALMLLLAHCLIENILLFLGFDLISFGRNLGF